MSDRMKVVYNQGEIVEFSVKTGTRANIEMLACNVTNDSQGIRILKILQEKYGFLEGWEFVKKDPENKPKKFLDFD